MTKDRQCRPDTGDVGGPEVHSQTGAPCRKTCGGPTRDGADVSRTSSRTFRGRLNHKTVERATNSRGTFGPQPRTLVDVPESPPGPGPDPVPPSSSSSVSSVARSDDRVPVGPEGNPDPDLIWSRQDSSPNRSGHTESVSCTRTPPTVSPRQTDVDPHYDSCRPMSGIVDPSHRKVLRPDSV